MNTILIVEDDKILLDMYADAFKHNGFTIIIAEDGKKGLDLALSEKPNIILLDLALPKIHGIEIMKSIRIDTWGKTVPIIVLTNLNVDGKILEAITRYNPVYCLLKANTTPEEVISKAKEVIRHE